MLLSSFIFKYKITKGKIASLGLAIIGLALVLNVFSPDAFIAPSGIMWMALNWVATVSYTHLLRSGRNGLLLSTSELARIIVCPAWLSISLSSRFKP